MQNSNASSRSIGQRTAVVGCCGVGKSTLARRIAARTGQRYVNADEIFWLPGWVQRPKPEYRRMLTEMLSGDGWVFDGNIGSNREIALPRIDTLIWLDYSWGTTMSRLLRRTVRRAWTKEEIFSGNRESWRQSFASKESILLFAWGAYGDYRTRYQQMFADLPEHISYAVRLTSPRDAETFVRSL
ncbi:MAG: adenylate kinase [Planctomycetota bacterium]